MYKNKRRAHSSTHGALPSWFPCICQTFCGRSLAEVSNKRINLLPSSGGQWYSSIVLKPEAVIYDGHGCAVPHDHETVMYAFQASSNGNETEAGSKQ